MANTSIFGLTATATLANGDVIPVVDVSDTAQSVNGSTRKVTLSNVAAFVLASPALTGTPTAPTAAANTNTTQVATTAFVTSAVSTSITEVSDEFTATAAQTTFTISHAKGTNRTIKMYINGIRISNTAYSDSSTTVTYTSANNGGYTILAGDRIQFDFSY